MRRRVDAAAARRRTRRGRCAACAAKGRPSMSGTAHAPIAAPTRRRARCSTVSHAHRAVLGEWVRIAVAGPAGAPRPGHRRRPGRHGGAGARGHASASPPPAPPSRSPATSPAPWSGEELLGRASSTASGAPLDGLPPPVGEARRAGRGARRINPVRRRPAGRLHRDRHLRHRRHEHAGARPEAPGLLRRRAPRARAGRARSWRTPARRTASRSPSSSWPSGITAARDAQHFLERFERERRAGAQRPLPQPAPATRRSSGCWRRALALAQAEYLAFERGHARAGGDGRHHQLLRGAARARRRARGDPRPARLSGLHVHRPRHDLRARRRAAGRGRGR